MKSRAKTAEPEFRTSGRAGAGSTKPKLLELCAVDFTVYHFVLPLGRALRRDFDVHFASSPGPYVRRIREEGFTYHCIPIERSYNALSHLKSFFSLKRLMENEGYEVVHTHTPIASLVGRMAARRAKVPIVLYTAHGFYFHERMGSLKRRFFISLERFARPFTDYTFTVSAEDRDTAIALGVAGEDSVLHVGNGVDLARFDPARLRSERWRCRKELGINATDPVLCIVGRLVREKGYLELIDAFSRVVRDVPRAHLVVVGGALESDHDDASAAIIARADATGVRDRIHFLSFRTDVEAILCASDVFVLPSHREGMPVSILEAMAMGLPVVATNIRGSREAVLDGVTGVLVDVGDVGALARATADLLADPAKRASYGREARRIAEERYGEGDVIQKQLDVIRRLQMLRGPAGG